MLLYGFGFLLPRAPAFTLLQSAVLREVFCMSPLQGLHCHSRAAFLIPLCFCLPNCSLVRTGHLLQVWQTAALLDKVHSWLLNQTRADADQLCAELPLAKPLTLKFMSLLWRSAKEESNLGKRGSSGRRGLVLFLLNDTVITSYFQGSISECLWLAVVTLGNICSWKKRNNMEIWLSSLPSVRLVEEMCVSRKTTIYICSVKSPCAGKTREEKKLKPLQGSSHLYFLGFALLPWSIRALCVFNWTRGFK